MRPNTRLAAALLAFTVSVALAGCSGESSGTASGPVTINYALWDDLQQPAYQQCANAFTKANPNIKVKITQTAWDQYWTNLTTQLASGDAPDVFTDEVGYYPVFAKNNQIMDLAPRIAADKIDLSQYQAGLADRWLKDGKRYGLPKDWDTVAIVYNKDLARAAGFDAASLANLTWNPNDGGTFEKFIAKSTIDVHGKNGLDPDFDKKHVKVHGIELTYEDGSVGQNGFGDLAASDGFHYLDKNPFGTKYKFDDPALSATITWMASLAAKGYAAPFDKASTLGTDAILNAGRSAMTMTGSWTINTYLGATARQHFAFAPLPVGPEGRKTIMGGLSDAIFAGTQHPDQAWQWVKYLASPACQDVVAGKKVVFPAIKSSSEKALAAQTAAGHDVKAFSQEATEPGDTVLAPITDHGDQVTQEVQSALESVWLGQDDAASALTKAQKQVDSIMAQP
ncbi:ABC transporter substrate-binding protein [Streptomyces sp. NPDC087856]|uniref:ABC transporter substrate-binding protein n=1 Tax=Streptomyces sp. NPDC087856 TaxID=3365811 RepID=UPI0037F458EB